MAPNPLDPRVLAIGSGDGLVRIWRTASPKALVDSHYITQKTGASAKATALAWHPNQEGTLAFGTDEGRLFVADAFNVRATPK